MLNPAGEFTAPPGPLAGLGERERKGGVREEGRGGDEREKEEGEEREGDAVSQLQFLDQPVITMGLYRTVSEKSNNFRQKIAFFLHLVFNAPRLRGSPSEFCKISYSFDSSLGMYEIILQRL